MVNPRMQALNHNASLDQQIVIFAVADGGVLRKSSLLVGALEKQGKFSTVGKFNEPI